MDTFFTIEELEEVEKLLPVYKNSYNFENNRYTYVENIPFILKKYFERQNNVNSLFEDLSSDELNELEPSQEEIEEMFQILEENCGEMSEEEWILS